MKIKNVTTDEILETQDTTIDPSSQTDDDNLENQIVQTALPNQTSVNVYSRRRTQETVVNPNISKTTAETKEGEGQDYATTKPRRITIRARVDNGEGS